MMTLLNLRKPALLSLLLLGSSACGEIIGADFDAKTVYPDYFTDGGADAASGGDRGLGGDAAGTGSKTAGGGTTSSGGSASGGSTGGMATGGMATGGNESGGSSTGGSSTGGAGTGGTGTGGMGTGGDATGGTGGGTPCTYGASGCEFNVVLNEVRGQGGPDFIELYNAGTDTVDLAGCAVTDQNDRADFATNSILGPGEYWVTWDAAAGVTCDTDTCNLLDFGISAGGEWAYFKAPNNSIIDSVEYPDENGPGGLTNGQTLGRSPNGSGSFVTLSSASPGETNSPPAVAP